MKVTAIKSYSVASGDGRPYFIVKVETDEGIYRNTSFIGDGTAESVT